MESNDSSGSHFTTAVGKVLGRSISHTGAGKENQELKETIDKLKKELEEKDKSELDESAIKKLKEKNQTLDGRIGELEKQLAEGPEKEINEHKQRSDELKAKHRHAKDKAVEEARKYKGQKEESDEAMKALIVKTEGLESQLANLEAVQIEIADLKSELERERENNPTQEAHIQELKGEILKLNGQLEGYKQHGSQADQTQLTQLISKHTKPLEDELVELKQGNFELRGEVGNLKTDKENLEEKIKKLNDTCQVFQERNTVLIKEQDSLREQLNGQKGQSDPANKRESESHLTLKIPTQTDATTESPGTVKITPVTKHLRSLCRKDEGKRGQQDLGKVSQEYGDSQQSSVDNIPPGTPVTPVRYDGNEAIVVPTVNLPQLVGKDHTKPSLGRQRSQSNPNISSTKMQQVESVQEKNQNKDSSKTWAGWGK